MNIWPSATNTEGKEIAAKKRKMKFTDSELLTDVVWRLLTPANTTSRIRDVSERNHIRDWDISESVSAVGVIKRTPAGCKSQGLSIKTKEIRPILLK